MTREQPRARQFEAAIQIIVCIGENLIEHPTQSEDRGPRIDAETADRDLAYLAAGRRRALEQSHLESCMRKIDGTGEARDARSDDGDSRTVQND
jgi:hypothetical protein